MDLIGFLEFICFQCVIYRLSFSVFMIPTTKNFICVIAGNCLLIPFLIFAKTSFVLQFIAGVILYIFLPMLLLKGNNKKHFLLMILGLLGVFTILEFLLDVLVMLFLGKIHTSAQIIYSVIASIILIVMASFPKMKQRIVIFAMSETRVKVLITVCIWLVLLLLFGASYLLPTAKKYSIILFFGILVFFSILTIFFLCYALITNNLQKRHYEKINGLIEHDYNNQVRYYENMNKANADLRKFRHDYENMKIGLFTYLENEDYKGACAYLQQGDDLIRQRSCTYNTGHAIANALLSDKADQVSEENIKIEFHGLIPCDALTPIDLCIVLGNTLDNAIEACRKFPADEAKEIHVSVKTIRNFIFFTITNPTHEKVHIMNNRVTTTKTDKSSHGIGLYSVERVARKYDGDLNLTYENGLFIVKLDFEIQQGII